MNDLVLALREGFVDQNVVEGLRIAFRAEDGREALRRLKLVGGKIDETDVRQHPERGGREGLVIIIEVAQDNYLGVRVRSENSLDEVGMDGSLGITLLLATDARELYRTEESTAAEARSKVIDDDEDGLSLESEFTRQGLA